MKYPEQDVIDAIITALEGGSNYWYFINDCSAAGNDKKYALSERILRAVIFDGKKFEISDINDEDENREIIGEISLANIERGIELYEAEREPFDAAMDADEADCLFQYIVMGSIEYA
jgi:hypothetical protein